MSDQKNLVLAIIISGVILLGWFYFVQMPQEAARQARQQEIAAQQAAQEPPAQIEGVLPGLGDGVPTGAPETVTAADGVSRDNALRKTARIAIESEKLSGSIALTGALFDDLILNGYRETIEPDSPRISLLEPKGVKRPYYVQMGWLTEDNKFLGRDAEWRADSARLTPASPVTLTWDNGEGLVFERRISLDENYMFTVTQRIRNTGAASVTLSPYGLISRTGTPDVLGYYILHEGVLGVFDGTLEYETYEDLRESETFAYETQGGWLGITDKFWLVALVPDQEKKVAAKFSHGQTDLVDKYQTDYRGEAMRIPPGGSAEVTNRIFAGAKIVRMLDAYEADLGVTRFDLAVDFGWFYFLTKPIFYMLDWFFGVLGNFGLAILALTVVIKLLFFPLANKSYKAMSKMKLLQPKMKELKEQFGDDRIRLNKEMMELYKREKVSPAAGCLPMVVQIPVFFSLYKVLFVTIEMRQTPFYGWISDLSAPDPLGILTLFGLIDWQVPAALAVVNLGIWPLLMGGTMMLQQRLNPPPPDPMQAKMMMLLPFFFMFILAGFPAGLVIYWTWNNLLSITQQYVIMRRVRREAEEKTAHIDLAALAAQEPVDDNPKPDVVESVSTPPKKKKGKRKRRR